MALHTPLARISGIPQPVSDVLSRRGFATTRDLLSLSAFEVREMCEVLPTETVALAFQFAARSAAPKRKTALQLLGGGAGAQAALAQRIKTGLDDVDAALLGGLRYGTLSEIVGPNGVGKTQLILQLCASAGRYGDVLYFDTENAFNPQRLLEIASLRFPDEYSSTAALENLSRRVHIHFISSIKELSTKLQELESFIALSNVRLIVIDSVAAVVRRDFGVGGGESGNNAAQISDVLATESSRMKALAEHYNLAVVATNHVTSASTRGSEDRYATAALGNTWHHATNLRIVLEYLVPGGAQGRGREIRTAGDTMTEGRIVGRVLRIAKSSVSAATSFPYAIDGTGLRLGMPVAN